MQVNVMLASTPTNLQKMHLFPLWILACYYFYTINFH